MLLVWYYFGNPAESPSLSQQGVGGVRVENALVKSFGTGKVRIVMGGVLEVHLIVSNTSF